MRRNGACLLAAAASIALLCTVACGGGSTRLALPIVPAPSSVPGPSIALAVSPSSPVIRVSGSVRLGANTPVTWAVQEGAAGGAITSDGTYSAPSSPGVYHVTATSVATGGGTVTIAVEVQTRGFVAAADLANVRLAHTATLLPNGRVLVVGGGFGPDLFDGFWVEGAAEIYDPTSGRFTPAGMSQRDFHTATLLSNGKVLLAGGEVALNNSSPSANGSAELFNPATGSFEPTGSMITLRESHTATLLRDGRVLIAGGLPLGGPTAVAVAEIYDPVSGQFTPTGHMVQPRYDHTATLLPDARVLIVGGMGAPKTAEIYDPATGSFAPAGSINLERAAHAATLLRDGRVLITGGGVTFGGGVDQRSEIYDPTTGSFTLITASMHEPRKYHSATLLDDGKVLVAGGLRQSGSISSTELFDPTTGQFTRASDLIAGRFWHSATSLPDGTVLLIGGASSNDGLHTDALRSAEIYK